MAPKIIINDSWHIGLLKNEYYKINDSWHIALTSRPFSIFSQTMILSIKNTFKKILKIVKVLNLGGTFGMKIENGREVEFTYRDEGNQFLFFFLNNNSFLF